MPRLPAQAGLGSAVARLLVSSGQWGEGQVEEGRTYAELWVRRRRRRGGEREK